MRLQFDPMADDDDRFFRVQGRPPELQRVELSFVHVAPSVVEVEASALQSRLLTMVDRLVEWLGPKGRAVTQTGAFKPPMREG